MSELSKPDVVAIVVTYNSHQVLRECLTALRAQDIATIVIDNASTDNSRDIAAECAARVISNHLNEGYGRANNAGIRAATAKFCLILNPDVRIDPGLVNAFLAAANRYPDAAIFGPKIIEPDGRIFDRPTSILETGVSSNATSSVNPDNEAINLSGACLFVRRSIFEELGGFDPNIFLFYEDDDLCFRMRQRGWKLMTVEGAVARHNRGNSTARSPAMTYRTPFHQAWSRQYVLKKHGKRRDAVAVLLRSTAKYVAAVLTGNTMRKARHAGSLAGTWTAITGKSALKYEGLQ